MPIGASRNPPTSARGSRHGPDRGRELPPAGRTSYRCRSLRRVVRPRRHPRFEESKGTRVPTYTPKASEIERTWYVVDAEGLTLGRMATEVARVLRGKHKPTFAPHIDTGDHVIIINADKVVLSPGKAEAKQVYRHSGYPGGIRSTTYAQLL